MPLFARCCEQDAEDYFEEMLELLNYVVYYAESISPQLWSLVPKLHSIYHDWGREYLNQLGNCLDSFITRSPEAFLTINNGQLVQSIVSICRDALISDEAKESMQDYDQHGAPKLVESMLHACRGRIDPIVPDLITFVLMRLDTCESRSLKIAYSALSSHTLRPVIALPCRSIGRRRRPSRQCGSTPRRRTASARPQGWERQRRFSACRQHRRRRQYTPGDYTRCARSVQ